jgi:ATP-dependent DNA helicase HFM1/MER3
MDYRGIFKQYTHFNYVQSKVFDEVMYTNQSLVISAPTGSGKTGILELSIVRLMILDQTKEFKIIYSKSYLGVN